MIPQEWLDHWESAYERQQLWIREADANPTDAGEGIFRCRICLSRPGMLRRSYTKHQECTAHQYSLRVLENRAQGWVVCALYDKLWDIWKGLTKESRGKSPNLFELRVIPYAVSGGGWQRVVLHTPLCFRFYNPAISSYEVMRLIYERAWDVLTKSGKPRKNAPPAPVWESVIREVLMMPPDELQSLLTAQALSRLA